MNLPTIKFSATLPYTSDAPTAASTNGTASAGSGGRTSASPSSPLPGDAADFAQAVHGASPQQGSVPGQSAPMHDPEPVPQGRQSAQPAQPGQPQADAASTSATGNTGRTASQGQQPAQDPAPTQRTAPQGGREQAGDMPSTGPTDQRTSGATNRPGEKGETGTPRPMRTSGKKSDMGESNTSGQRRTSGQTDTPRPVRTSGTPGDAGEKASTGKTNKPDSRGDAILNALGGAASAEGALAAPAFMVGMPHLAEPTHLEGTAPPGGPANLAEISGMDQRVLTQLVDSILVSAQEGKQEVRIKVQDAVLKDTTIVVRLQDGQLDVQLRTGDSYSSQLLHQNVDTLRHALEGRQLGQTSSTVPSPLQVQVRVEDHETPQDDTGKWGQQGQRGQQGQQDQRSRGNFLWDRDE